MSRFLAPFIAFCFVIMPACIYPAQEEIPPVVSVVDGHESEEETLQKCLQDLTSPDRQIRLRAVMVMAKYSHPMATKGIRDALADQDQDVRHSAVVAAIEASIISDRETTSLLLNLLDDPNVHTRRTISTFLPNFIGRGSSSILMVNGQQRVTRRSDPAEIRLVVKAFSDPDPTVRKNMLSHLNIIRLAIPELESLPQVLIPLLKDKNHEIRLLALSEFGQTAGQAEKVFTTSASHLAADPSPEIRELLAKQLGQFKGRESLSLLKKLVEDEEMKVRIQASISLLRTGEDEQAEVLLDMLSDPLPVADDTVRQVAMALSLQKEWRKLLKQALDSQHAKVRLEALRAYRMQGRETVDAETYWQALTDPFSPVRQEARLGLQLLPGQAHPPPEELQRRLEDLMVSSHSDLRETALLLSSRLPNSNRTGILSELMLDADAEIRSLAIQQIILCRCLSDWQEIATLALTDDAESVRHRTQNAIRSIRNINAGKTLLKNLELNPPAPDIRIWAQEQLAP